MATKPIAVVAPLADLAVEALMPPAPPALEQGGPVTAQHVAQAGALCYARKRHRTEIGDGVTHAEYLDAKRAKTSWNAEAALARDPQPAPPGFVAAIMAAIAPLQAGIEQLQAGMAPLQAGMAQLQADSAANTAAIAQLQADSAANTAAIAQLQADSAASSATIARLDAKVHNQRSLAINARRRAAGGDRALVPIQMDRGPIALGQPGFVAGLPNQPMPAPAPAQLAVGGTSAVFPAGFNELLDLSHASLCRLAAEYSDDFGVLAADSVATRQRKFLNFVCDTL